MMNHARYYPLLVVKRSEIRRDEEVDLKSRGCRRSVTIIISCAGGPEDLGFVGQISDRRGPLRELALGRYGDCSLSRFFDLYANVLRGVLILRADSQTRGGGWLV